jgi:hypothetical protein
MITMLKKFIAWIYSLDDSLNPLIVREIRRELRNGGYFASIGIYLLFFTIFISLRLLGVINNELLISIFSMICFALWFLGYFIGVAQIKTAEECANRDEMFSGIPLSPRQYLHAYWGLSIFVSSYFISLSLPLLIAMIIIGHSFSVLVIPPTVFLANQAITLITLSFISQSTSAGRKYTLTVYECIQITVLSIFNFCSFILWFVISVTRINYDWPSDWKVWESVNVIHFFILMILFLIICRTAYKLNLRGFNTNHKPKFGELFRNTLVYFLLNITLVTIYWGIATIFFW